MNRADVAKYQKLMERGIPAHRIATLARQGKTADEITALHDGTWKDKGNQADSNDSADSTDSTEENE